MSNPFDMLGGMGGMGGLGGLLGGFQQKMQQIQAEAEAAEFDGTAGGGMVVARCNGRNEIVKLTIADEALEDRELMEDLIIAAVNDGMRQAKENLQNNLKELTAGLPIPPGLLGM